MSFHGPLPKIPLQSPSQDFEEVIEVEVESFPPPEAITNTPPDRNTPTIGHALGLYQGLLSVFDELTSEERLDFVELALLFKELSPNDRKALIVEAALYHVRNR